MNAVFKGAGEWRKAASQVTFADDMLVHKGEGGSATDGEMGRAWK